MTDDVLSLPATALVALYRSRRLSPVEVATAALRRIELIDPVHNAFVAIDPFSVPSVPSQQRVG